MANLALSRRGDPSVTGRLQYHFVGGPTVGPVRRQPLLLVGALEFGGTCYVAVADLGFGAVADLIPAA